MALVPVGDLSIAKNGAEIVFASVKIVGNYVQFVVVRGQPGVSQMMYDLDSGALSEVAPGANRMPVQMTYAVIDLKTRRSAVEYNRLGPKFSDITDILRNYGVDSSDYSDDFEIALTPVVSKEFAEEIVALKRIQKVYARISKTNVSWNDVPDQLSDIAAESDGRAVAIEIPAYRGKSLSKTKGIILQIVNRIRQGVNYFEDIRIHGVREGSEEVVPIPLKSFQESRRVKRQFTDGGQVLGQQFLEELQEITTENE